MRRRRRLLDRLQESAGADGVEQVELVEDQHLARALDGRQRGLAHDLGSLLGGDRRADAHDLTDVGMLAGQCQPSVTRVRHLAAGQQQRGERAGRLVLGRARGSDEQVGVHRGDRGATQRVDGTVLTDDVGPHRTVVSHGRPARRDVAGPHRVPPRR